MRLFAVLILIFISILEIGPIPLTPLLLIYVVLCRPPWFYAWILKIYGKNRP